VRGWRRVESEGLRGRREKGGERVESEGLMGEERGGGRVARVRD
jgi:hypothetical protein